MEAPHLDPACRGALAALAGCVITAASASAAAASLEPATRLAVETFVAGAATGAPGEVSVQVETPASPLPACARLQPFLPQGVKAWGRVAVGLRCAGERPWTRFLPVRVVVEGSYLVAARPIAAGTVVGAADIDRRRGDLTALPRDVATESSMVVGLVAANPLAPGAPVRSDLLRGAVVVRQGQPVRVVVEGEAFTASAEARALADGIAGRMLQVKTVDGRLLSGRLTPEGTLSLRP